MAESKAHKTTANRIAQKFNTDYNQGPGADIQARNAAIEVEIPDTVSDGLRQLRGYQKPVYIAGTNHLAVKKAREAPEGTTVGVMDNQGNIIKRSTRLRKARR